MSGELMSGFIGALAAVVLSKIVEGFVYYWHRKMLVSGIIAECDYNLSIIDEVLTGSTERNGSFKRMSVEYLKSAREAAVEYSLGKDFMIILSRVIVDLELFNKEADYIFDGNGGQCTYAGIIKDEPVVMTKETELRDIRQIMVNARKGVIGSLMKLKEMCSN